ncbi:MAG: 1-deoxy-D-xylulose-5-phosphate reductoisomerase [Oscillospiraceae bacterium]|jgi:1-deoxy-D-xylulose-5-phosphate reductoisomerase|nr:1-deoxy-D-xylulose-5-phosphate reductoisomerase [Oscillospiraceae bacterium]
MDSDSVVLLGSTGSIGTQTLDVARSLKMRVAALAAGGGDVPLLERQAREFVPELIAVYDGGAARELEKRLSGLGIRILSGEDGVLEAARFPRGTIVNAIGGAAGIAPAIESAGLGGRKLALANKESIVCAGERIMELSRRGGAEIIPVDSEHSAIFQCLQGEQANEIKSLILTASGGPFYGKTREQMRGVTPEEALRHPNWSMGRKITIDSATMMNKGFELIEAMRLFSLPPEKIRVLIHRQSVVHSAVEFEDGAIIAQLGAPDMRLPIQYALTYPERLASPAAALDLTKTGALTFEEPDTEAFPALSLARRAAALGGTACAALNGSNDAAVKLFLEKKISFDRIPALICAALDSMEVKQSPSIRDIMSAYGDAYAFAERMCS